MNINIKTKLIISSQKLLTVAIINVLAANIVQTMAPTRKLYSTMDKPWLSTRLILVASQTTLILLRCPWWLEITCFLICRKVWNQNCLCIMNWRCKRAIIQLRKKLQCVSANLKLPKCQIHLYTLLFKNTRHLMIKFCLYQKFQLKQRKESLILHLSWRNLKTKYRATNFKYAATQSLSYILRKKSKYQKQ